MLEIHEPTPKTDHAHAEQVRAPVPLAQTKFARDPGVIYTCPMHPQIRRDEPGNCPICGMTLEPLNAGQSGATSPELQDMTRRFVFGAGLVGPGLLLAWGGQFCG